MIVLDASAILALLQEEAGEAHVLAALVAGAVTSSVNRAEVEAKLIDGGRPARDVLAGLEAISLFSVPFTADHAHVSAMLRPATRRAGLSLADRACLATAIDMSASVLTADRAWADLDVGVDVRLIR